MHTSHHSFDFQTDRFTLNIKMRHTFYKYNYCANRKLEIQIENQRNAKKIRKEFLFQLFLSCVFRLFFLFFLFFIIILKDLSSSSSRAHRLIVATTISCMPLISLVDVLIFIIFFLFFFLLYWIFSVQQQKKKTFKFSFYSHHSIVIAQ